MIMFLYVRMAEPYALRRNHPWTGSQANVKDSALTWNSEARWLRIKHLTDRFHVAVRLFSNRSQMTSKCGKNEEVAHETLGECVADDCDCENQIHLVNSLQI